MRNTKPSNPSNYQGAVYNIAIQSPLRRCFDYLPPVEHPTLLANGVRVLVSFGRRQVIGIVVGSASQSDLPESKLKAILSAIDEKPLLPKTMMKVLHWAAEYYQHPLGDVYSTALPSRLRTLQKTDKRNLGWQLVKTNDTTEGDLFGKAYRQRALFDIIQTSGPVTASQMADAGFNSATLKGLKDRGLVESVEQPPTPLQPFSALTAQSQHELSLNFQQQAAVDLIRASNNTYQCFVLDGVTGSGKTEVYMRVMEDMLCAGKQCLVLIPEIGLTPQTIDRFRKRFTCPTVALHSGLNDSERLAAWQQAKSGAAGIILGTRSAIFTPMLNPGIIILDEEHDSSFKQQEGFRYSARDLSVMRGREEKISVILGSATPSLESLANCHSKKFQHIALTQRAGEAVPANIQLVDFAEQSLKHGFTDYTLAAINQQLKNGGQVLIFINRRGFAPVVNCASCGWSAECEACNAQFTVHSKPAGLRCHHCGAAQRIPTSCPHCQSRDLTTAGIGTQQVESFLQQQFASTPVIRIDRDSTRRKNSLDEKLNLIKQGDPCLLIGTQMIAKGHHFPGISLVVILDADSGLFSADFRGLEHMAQTIVQVAGRAGREKRRGEVIIQSRHSSHEALIKLSSQPYNEYADYLLETRKATEMPPYSYLAILRAESPDFNNALRFLSTAASQTQRLIRVNSLKVEALGPLPAPMEKRAGRYRLQLLLKTKTRSQLHKLLSQLVPNLELIKLDSKSRWSLDVDPQDLI
ncbi:MAG TPA: primosomal protein N' [Gammaproteobacteria bacterium]|nr:primosomal protein N' [Gammaproteobacteria bacterium]